MQKIIPHLWFDTQAKEAAKFYTSIFPNSNIIQSDVMKDTPSGDTDVVSFELNGFAFMAISAGPYFKVNPSISFMVNFDPSKDSDAQSHLDALWEKLSEGGEALMPLQEYPFSKHYGWIKDKYGVTWQLILTNPSGEERPFIIPSIMFENKANGKAEAAVRFYTSVFKNSKLGTFNCYPEGAAPDQDAKVMFTDFMLEGQWFAAMDGGGAMHDFNFSEGISLLVNCSSQEEIDYYWEKLTAVPEAEQCGWLKDTFGVSWQVHPEAMGQMMKEGSPEQRKRLTEAFLKMKKFDIAALEKAFNAAE